MYDFRVKNADIVALDCGDKAAEWMSSFLGKDGLRMCYSAPSLCKRHSIEVKKDHQTNIQQNDMVAFAEWVPCMLMCDSSLADLNKRLDKQVTCINFRPNLMIEGTRPYDEDNWREVFIGENVRLRYVDNCLRCLITTVDPFTGIKDDKKQPLQELKGYRCFPKYGPNKPSMGIHTAVEQVGQIQVGDPVYVIRK